MRIVSFVTIVVLTLSGCSDWQDELDKTRKAFQETIDKAVLAFPGERYMRLLDQAHSEKKEERDQAQQLIKRLFNVTLDEEYVATAWFDYDPANGRLRAAIRPGGLNMSEAAARLVTAVGEGLTFEEVGTTTTPALTEAERSRLINEKLTNVIRLLGGTPHVASRSGEGGSYDYSLGFGPGLLQPPFNNVHCKGYMGEFNKKGGKEALEQRIDTCRSPVVNELHAAIMTGFQSGPLPKDGQYVSITWDPLKHSYLYVFIPDSDLKRHVGKRLRIRAIVHKKGDVKTTLHDMKHVEFPTKHFVANTKFVRSVTDVDEQLAWSAERLDHNIPGAIRLIEARQEIDAALAAMVPPAKETLWQRVSKPFN